MVRRLGFEQVDVWDPATAERLLSQLEPRGWTEQRFALMAAPRQRDASTAAAAAEEVDPAGLAVLRRQWLLEYDFFASDPELVAQILDADRLLAAATPTRGFCVRRDGSPVAMGLLIGGRDRTAMIEDVYTTPELRGQGLGAAVVLAAERAAREAGCDLVYLPTDADGLAQLFYRKLGYAPLGVISRFVTS